MPATPRSSSTRAWRTRSARASVPSSTSRRRSIRPHEARRSSPRPTCSRWSRAVSSTTSRSTSRGASSPSPTRLLHTIGIIELREVQQENDEHRVTFTQRTVHWERLGRAVSDPLGLLEEAYGWDAATGVDTVSLFENLQELGVTLGLRSDFRAVDERARAAFDAALGGDGQVPSPETTKVLDVPLLPIPDAAIGVEVYPVADAGGSVDGFGITLYVEGQSPTTLTLTDWLSAKIKLAAFATGFGVVIRKGRDAKVLSALFDSSPATVLDSVSVDASVAFQYASPDSQSIVLLGRADGTRLEVALDQARRRAVEAGGCRARHPERGRAAEAHAAVKSDESDGFLHSVLGDGFFAAVISPSASDPARPLRLGRTGLEYRLGLALQLGPLFISRITLKVSSEGDRSALITSVDAGLALGPIAAVVKDIGLELRVDHRSLAFSATPIFSSGSAATGIGIVVDARAVVGGGFLSFDPQKEQYSGVLHSRSTTRSRSRRSGCSPRGCPTARKGFSLVAHHHRRRLPPIQLGFGFNLTGIGGLLAINRTFDENVLRAGLKNHTLDGVMFPRDPSATPPDPQQPQSRLPPRERAIICSGPMAPDRLGHAAAHHRQPRPRARDSAPACACSSSPRSPPSSPTRSNDLIRLQMDAVGVIDFDQGTAVARRHAPRFAPAQEVRPHRRHGHAPDVGGFAHFALAVGGLHPAFNPPPGFPKLDRIAISLASGDNPRLRCEAYFAHHRQHRAVRRPRRALRLRRRLQHSRRDRLRRPDPARSLRLPGRVLRPAPAQARLHQPLQGPRRGRAGRPAPAAPQGQGHVRDPLVGRLRPRRRDAGRRREAAAAGARRRLRRC